MTSSAIQQDSPLGEKVAHESPSVSRLDPGDIVIRVENHLESWRQIMLFIGLARGKKFDSAEEDQFLELKGVIAQELEMILASIESNSPLKDDVHAMLNNAPSLRYLSQLPDGALGNIEHQWHLIYIGWHAALGQLKVKHGTLESLQPKSRFMAWWRPG